jgi:hypothetical protein
MTLPGQTPPPPDPAWPAWRVQAAADGAWRIAGTFNGIVVGDPADRPATVPTNPLGQGEKTVFLSHLYIKTMILPRQARDKHRENSKKRAFSHQASTVMELRTTDAIRRWVALSSA